MSYKIVEERPNFCAVRFNNPGAQDFQMLHDAGWRVEGGLIPHGGGEATAIFYRPDPRPDEPYLEPETLHSRWTKTL